jgi:transcriptional regulator with XRE-family HTH domain
MTRTLCRSTNKLRLGEFIRTRRERLAPADFGLPPLGRRRTPGLRRDEVAQLSRISIAYYTWIEQGKDMNISSDVLNALARTLRFTEAERTYVFTLAGVDISDHVVVDEPKMHPTLEHLLTSGKAVCSFKYDCWFNVLGATPLANAVFGLAAGVEPLNLLDAVFTDPTQRRLWFDWEGEARLLTGMFRQSLAKWPDDPEGEALLYRLRAFPDFGRIWQDHEVRHRPSPIEYFRHEPWHLRHAIGRLSVHRIALTVPTCSRRELLLYSPADDLTAERLCELVRRDDRAVNRHDAVRPIA